MAERIDKHRVHAALRARLSERLQTLAASQHATQSGATHAETRAEHPKDTRAIEATYLARGLAERVEALATALAQIEKLELARFGPDDPIAVSALVALEDERGAVALSFLVPAGGGESLDVDGASVRSVTPASPLGRGLLGRRLDDEVELELPAGRQRFAILWLA